MHEHEPAEGEVEGRAGRCVELLQIGGDELEPRPAFGAERLQGFAARARASTSMPVT